jgi:hypothetical protein
LETKNRFWAGGSVKYIQNANLYLKLKEKVSSIYRVWSKKVLVKHRVLVWTKTTFEVSGWKHDLIPPTLLCSGSSNTQGFGLENRLQRTGFGLEA